MAGISSVSLTGSFVKLSTLKRRFFAVAGRQLAAKITTNLAAEAVTQVNLGFRASRDPYGTPWERTEWSSPNPLRDSGRLQRSFHSRVTGEGFVVATDVIYAAIQHFGGTIVPKAAKMLSWTSRAIPGRHFAKSVTLRARPMLPVESRGWGLWEAPMRALIKGMVRRQFMKNNTP